jgi:hypothetical protein
MGAYQSYLKNSLHLLLFSVYLLSENKILGIDKSILMMLGNLLLIASDKINLYPLMHKGKQMGTL